MATINYNDLQFKLEEHYFNKISPVLEKLKEKYDFKNAYLLKMDRLFYSLINNAINIDNHYAVKYILDRVKNKLGIDIKVKFYLYQSTLFNVSCLPKKSSNTNELYIFVSQHFFNNLNEDEQVGIIGHEIAHFIFGHLDIPIREIIEHSFNIGEINGLKSDLLNWSKSCELTADMIGLVSNDFNFKAYSTAIIKHHTGLNDSSISNFNISPVVNLVLDQYTMLANDPLYAGETSTHPLTPLRVMIINSITSSKLIKNFGDVITKNTKTKYVIEFNKKINDLIEGIYPEMIPESHYAENILPPLMIAVAMADGQIDTDEIRAIERMAPGHKTFKEYEGYLFKEGIMRNTDEIVIELVNEGIRLAHQEECTQHSITPIIRCLLLIAASDGNIEIEELNVIYNFAKEFEFTRQDMILILQTSNSIHY